MKKILTSLLLTSSAILAGLSLAQAEEIKMMSSIPYQKGNKIRNVIKNECTNLGNKLANFTQSFSQQKGIEISLTNSVKTNTAGKILKLEISDAVSQGNAFIGHRKFVEISGSLWKNGKKVASFDGQRSSGGGFGAGYKSSCAVLERCVKALGKDIAKWLGNPQDGASIGE